MQHLFPNFDSTNLFYTFLASLCLQTQSNPKLNSKTLIHALVSFIITLIHALVITKSIFPVLFWTKTEPNSSLHLINTQFWKGSRILSTCKAPSKSFPMQSSAYLRHFTREHDDNGARTQL